MGKVSRTCKLAGTQTGTCLMVSFPKGRALTALPSPQSPSLPSLLRPGAVGSEEPRSSLPVCLLAGGGASRGCGWTGVLGGPWS